MIIAAAADRPVTLASEAASAGQRFAAIVLTGLVFIMTLLLWPYAALQAPVFPGFLLIDQTALFMAYVLGAWVLYAQFRRGRSLNLLLAATASLFTAGMIALQCASFPGVFAPGATRLLGSGPNTTTWLWTFWHAGPAVLGLAYAATVRRGRGSSFAPGRTALAIAVSIAGALALTVGFGMFSTLLLPWLPVQTDGDDYTLFVTSGVGPALVVFTMASLAAMWWATRGGRTVLSVWIIASLVILTLDSIITQAGLSRGSVGWQSGRVGALASALAALAAYLHEVNATHVRAEAIAASELQRTELALRQAQRMEAVGHLTSGIAHDFNNLLTVMSTVFEVVQKRSEDNARMVKMAGIGLQAVEKGAALTAQLLSFSSRRSQRLETVDLNAVLLGFQPMAEQAVPSNVRLEWEAAPGLLPVTLDKVEFETALLNLIVNARDAMGGAKGRVVLSTRNAVVRTGWMPGGASPKDLPLQAGNYVAVAVADDGPGMPDGVAARAFDPFFTTKDPGKGTGLGLSQVHGFARSAGGLAVIRTAPSGTTIEIWLPAVAPPPGVSTAGCAPLVESMRRSGTDSAVAAL